MTMNPYDFPLFLDIDFGDSNALLVKSTAASNSGIDFDTDCITLSDLTDDCTKCTELTVGAMNIPQIGFLPATNKEFLESPCFLDPDINFYDHFEDTKCLNFPGINAEASSPLSLWDTPVEIDQPRFDDIFQVEESKAIQGPTLAQLNSNNEPFDSFNFNDIYITDETKPSINDIFLSRRKVVDNLVTNSSEQNVPIMDRSDMFSEISQAKKVEKRETNFPCRMSSCISNIATTSLTPASAFTNTSMTDVGVTKIEHFLNTNIPTRNHVVDLPIPTALKESRSSISVGPQLSEEPSGRQRNNSSTDRSVCSFSSLSVSNDEDFDSPHEEFVLDEEESSDADFCDSEKHNVSASAKRTSSGSKRKRYFWQYNVQSKGPKGPKASPETPTYLDPHFVSAASDPVFSSQPSFSGVKYMGKVRRGDGNDLTPNPHKLYSIGLELKKLGKIINDLEPTADHPFNARPKSRREKNKLASRVCRLKKKAQHEANKLKFYGLQKEHNNLCALLEQVKQLVVEKIEGRKRECVLQDVEKLLAACGKPKVAGNTAEFVNNILGKVAGGDLGGGVYEL